MTTPLIVPHPARSAGSSAILEHLACICPLGASRIELASVFVLADPAPHPVYSLAKRIGSALDSMVKTGQLTHLGIGKASQWCLGPSARRIGQDKPKPVKAIKRVKPSAYVGNRTPPRQYDALRCPVYQPNPWPVNRAGAQDFQAAPSVGVRC